MAVKAAYRACWHWRMRCWPGLTGWRWNPCPHAGCPGKQAV